MPIVTEAGHQQRYEDLPEITQYRVEPESAYNWKKRQVGQRFNNVTQKWENVTDVNSPPLVSEPEPTPLEDSLMRGPPVITSLSGRTVPTASEHFTASTGINVSQPQVENTHTSVAVTMASIPFVAQEMSQHSLSDQYDMVDDIVMKQEKIPNRSLQTSINSAVNKRKSENPVKRLQQKQNIKKRDQALGGRDGPLLGGDSFVGDAPKLYANPVFTTSSMEVHEPPATTFSDMPIIPPLITSTRPPPSITSTVSVTQTPRSLIGRFRDKNFPSSQALTGEAVRDFLFGPSTTISDVPISSTAIPSAAILKPKRTSRATSTASVTSIPRPSVGRFRDENFSSSQAQGVVVKDFLFGPPTTTSDVPIPSTAIPKPKSVFGASTKGKDSVRRSAATSTVSATQTKPSTGPKLYSTGSINRTVNKLKNQKFTYDPVTPLLDQPAPTTNLPPPPIVPTPYRPPTPEPLPPPISNMEEFLNPSTQTLTRKSLFNERLRPSTTGLLQPPLTPTSIPAPPRNRPPPVYISKPPPQATPSQTHNDNVMMETSTPKGATTTRAMVQQPIHEQTEAEIIADMDAYDPMLLSSGGDNLGEAFFNTTKFSNITSTSSKSFFTSYTTTTNICSIIKTKFVFSWFFKKS